MLQSRFYRWPRRWALAMLVALFALIGVGALTPHAAPSVDARKPTDLELYSRIVADMRAGMDYAHAAVTEQRRLGYPLRPFLTVRPPALAMALSQIPNAFAPMVFRGLVLAVAAAWIWRLTPMIRRPVLVVAAGCFMGLGLLPSYSTAEQLSGLHEAWAGLFIALSLAVWSPEAWGPAVGLGFVAALIRELALPYLALMAVLSVWDRRRYEAAAWAAALILVLGALAWHAHAVMALTTMQDPASPGWWRLGGYGFDLLTTQWSGWVFLTAKGAEVIVLPLALLGFAGWRGAYGVRAATLAGVYLAVFFCFGRNTNAYWGMLYTPLLALGIFASFFSAADILKAVLRPRGGAANAPPAHLQAS